MHPTFMTSTASIFLVSVAALLPALSGQTRQERMIERRSKKLAKPFVTSAPWKLDYGKARAAAKEQGKILLTYFTRSYSG